MPPDPAAPRFVAALDALDVRAGHRVLEVGCGSGAALGLALARGAARVVGIDRASAAVARARARHRGDARVLVERAELKEWAPREGERFERAFAVNVGDLWREPGRLVPRLADALAPEARLAILFEPPRGASPPETEALVAALDAAGFRARTSRGTWSLVVATRG